MNERPNPSQITPEVRRLIDAYLDGSIDSPDAARIEELAKVSSAVMAELEAQRSMLAALRAPSGRIDVTGAVLSKIHADSPFVEIERRQHRARRRTAVCVSVVIAVGGVALLQSMYPELSDFGTGERPISTLTEAGRRDAVDGAQAVASAVGTITRTLVEPQSPESPRRATQRRTALQLGDTSRYEMSSSWQLTSATSMPSGTRPIAWMQPCGESISVAWQAPSIVTIRAGELPRRGITWVGGWRQDVPGVAPQDVERLTPEK
ncbi:MAG: zf-HC2 domain-containing protein [Phycisphaerales bacterium]|nr:zf-HC2 domain-containing protein [Phycisphaerales bacterium]